MIIIDSLNNYFSFESIFLNVKIKFPYVKTILYFIKKWIYFKNIFLNEISMYLFDSQEN